MSTTNTIIALDILAGVLNTAAELQTLLQTAAAEGRDITDEELDFLKATNDDLEQNLLDDL